MSQALFCPLPEPAARPVFVRTASASRLHLVECPHVVDSDTHIAGEAELAHYPVCDWSQDQLDGTGRSHPTSLDEAMRELGTPAGTEHLIKEALRFVSYDEIWLPYSRSYVALGREGRAVAFFGKTYVDLVGGGRLELPEYRDVSHGGGGAAGVNYGKTCQKCQLAMPFIGECDNCS